MRRVLLALLLILGTAPGTWFYQTRTHWSRSLALRLDPVALPPKAEIVPRLGPFELEGVWALVCSNSVFGGYSALLPQPGGRLLAIGDNAQWFAFSPPGMPWAPAKEGFVLNRKRNVDRDTESATQDPVTGTIWTAREDSNTIARHGPGFRGFRSIRPPEMRAWPHNRGAEAMVRLADGRFIALAEGTTGLFEMRLHEAVLFPRDPLLRDKGVRFTFAGTPGFLPTDMAQLPDGRVLIVMRRLVWPLPLRFEGRIVIADPAAIRPNATWRGIEVARLEAPLPVDNFEGMAIERRADGRVVVWLISDDNHAATQRTLLWKMVVDPARLPKTEGAQARKKARK